MTIFFTNFILTLMPKYLSYKYKEERNMTLDL